MPGFADIVTPLALLMPLGGAGEPVRDIQQVPQPFTTEIARASGAATKAPRDTEQSKTPRSVPPQTLDSLFREMQRRQISVRQRVYVRITPRVSRDSMDNRRNMLARAPQPAVTKRYREKKPNRCVQVKEIMNVQTGSGNRLLLFMDNSRVMSVNLEKACRARDFYAGFYVEKTKDGKMCVERDLLQSRNGAKCGMERIMQLAEIED
jgi:hypothetical protein